MKKNVLVVLAFSIFLSACGGGANSAPLTTHEKETTISGKINPAVSWVMIKVTDPSSGQVVGTGASDIHGVYAINIEKPVEMGKVTVTPELDWYAFSPASQTISPTSGDYPRVVFEASPQVFELPPGRSSCPGEGVPDEFELPPSPGDQCI